MILLMRKLVIILFCVATQSADPVDHVVHLHQGSVRGYKSDLGDFYSFYGIPYATAPTGRNKFKAPLPPPTWSNIFNATDREILCPQPHVLPINNEDCLVVNVFVPMYGLIFKTSALSVIAYIHGGGFISGYGAMISSERLLKQNVIIANFNYRLGATGFLCLKSDRIPGNAGFKDQIAALRWIQDNIGSFGGNPNDVTIAGFEMGSVSVEYMILSPMAKGLFHKAISESGSVLSPYAEVRDPIAFARRFVSDINGHRIANIKELENFLLDSTTDALITSSYDSYQNDKYLTMGFTLCIEEDIKGIESFLIEPPMNILKNGTYNKVPYMTGIASHEGTQYLPFFDAWIESMENDFAEFLPFYIINNNKNEMYSIASMVKEFYFGNVSISIDNIQEYVDYFTDAIYLNPLLRSARLHTLNLVPVYVYFYTYIVSEYPTHPYSNKIRGATHCSASFCVNKIEWLYDPHDETKNDTVTVMHDRLTQLWSDFAKHGEPMTNTSDLLPTLWEKMEADRMNYLVLDMNMTMQDNLLKERFQFWKILYEKNSRNFSQILTSSNILLSVLIVIVCHIGAIFSRDE